MTQEVKPQDHPDFAGGWIWTELEIRWIEERIAKATEEAITAIKEALLAQKQEPIAMLFGSLPVYDRTTPPQRTWVNLTVDELIDLEHKHLRHEDLARAIEAKLKQKNGYAEEKVGD